MKQPMSYSKGKAHKIRQMREMAATIKQRSEKYKLMEKWEEVSDAGQQRIKITLKEGFSFNQTKIVPVEFFSDVPMAMRGMCKVYPVTEEMAFMQKKSDVDKLHDLISLTDKWLSEVGK